MRRACRDAVPPEWAKRRRSRAVRVRAAAARCRNDSSSAYYRDHHEERRTRLRPVTPIAGPPAASSPQTFRGNQLDKQARSGFTASHNDSVETRVYSQHRGGLHVFTTRFTHTKSASDVPHLRLRPVYNIIAVASRTLVILIRLSRNVQSSRTLKYVRVHRIKIIQRRLWKDTLCGFAILD